MPDRVLAAAQRGDLLDLTEGRGFDGRAAETVWSSEREVSAADLLEALTTTTGVHPRGVRIRGARIVGDLAWEWQRLKVPLELIDCWLEEPVHLDQAQVVGLTLQRCRIPGFTAEQLTSSGSLRLGRTVFDGSVLLKDASVAGEVVLSRATVAATRKHRGKLVAVDAQRLRTTGSLNLEHGFRAEGAVNLSGARIGGSLQCSGGHVINPGSSVLTAADVEVGGNVHLSNGFEAQGRITFNRARIEGNFSCDSATLSNPGGDALTAERATIGGALQLRGQFRATGRVRLSGAHVGGNLDCTNGNFDSADGGDSINAAGIQVDGNVTLRGEFRSAGRIQLDDATIGGTLDCDGATLVHDAAEALRARNLTISGDVRFDDRATEAHLTADGEVSLAGARIGGSVICVGGSFINPDGPALDLADATVGGSVWMTDTTVQGSLRLVRCRIQGDFSLWASSLEGNFSARGMNLAGNFAWARCSRRPGQVDLRRAQVGQIDDDETCWPETGQLHIDGLVYDRLSSRAPSSPQERLGWIRRQPGFIPDPYQQLVHVYRRNGQLAEATIVAMAQQDDLRRRGELSRPAQAWNWFIGRSIGHGYRPARAAWTLFAVYLVTLVAVWLGARSDAFIPVGNTATDARSVSSRCESTYPCLVPLAYSLESIVPILNLHQRDNWQPKSTTPEEKTLSTWLYLSTVLGYAGTTLLAAGLSGLARKT
jgi:hypothetical protein